MADWIPLRFKQNVKLDSSEPSYFKDLNLCHWICSVELTVQTDVVPCGHLVVRLKIHFSSDLAALVVWWLVLLSPPRRWRSWPSMTHSLTWSTWYTSIDLHKIKLLENPMNSKVFIRLCCSERSSRLFRSTCSSMTPLMAVSTGKSRPRETNLSLMDTKSVSSMSEFACCTIS